MNFRKIHISVSTTFKYKLQRIILFVFIASIIFISLLVLLAIVFNIGFNRPVSDDYTLYNLYHSGDWFDHITNSLQTMNGRYAQNLSSAILYKMFGMGIAYIIPALTLLWLFITSSFIINKIACSKKDKPLPKQKLLVIFSIAIIIITCIYSVPDIQGSTLSGSYQILFWSPGIITYFIPLALILSTLTALLYFPNFSRNRKTLVPFLFIMYIAGLFNEIQPATIIVLSFLGLIFIIIQKNFKKVKMLALYFIITIASSLMALMTIYTSSANQSRRILAQSPSINLDLIYIIFQKMSHIISSFMKLEYIIVFILSGVCIYVLFYSITKAKLFNNKKSYLWSIPIIIYFVSLAVSCTLVVIGYGQTTIVLNRTILIPQIAFTITLFVVGALLAEYTYIIIKKTLIVTPVIVIIIMALFFIALPKYMAHTVNQVTSTTNYMTTWDKQNNKLIKYSQTNSSQTIYLPDGMAGIGDKYSITCAENAPGTWLNKVMETYYNVRKICAESDLKQ